jgi:hypothetical protein
MFRFSPKRSLLARLLTSLGPPPPPPRRHFSKLADHGSLYYGQPAARALGGISRRGAPPDDRH